MVHMESVEQSAEPPGERPSALRRPHSQAITREEAAEILGVSTATIDRMRQQRPDIMRSYRMGRHVWLHRDDLALYIAHLRGEDLYEAA
jgi:excisionase family DNA binding protein